MTRRNTDSAAAEPALGSRSQRTGRSAAARRAWAAALLAGVTCVALPWVAPRPGLARPGGVEHPVGPDESCLDCHDDLLSAGSTLHAPAEAELCDACHVVAGESDVYTVTTPGGDQACLECHDENLKRAPEGGSLHSLLRRDACVVCHDPHASPQSALLRASINEVCLSCHARLTAEERAASPLEVDVATYEEAAKIFLGDDRTIGHPMLGHPVAGPAQPAETGGAMSCLSCHAAHASSHPGLMLGGFEICTRCHS